MRIRNVLDPRRVLLDVTGSSKHEILANLVATLALTHRDIDREALLETLMERERTSTTAIADGIAIPHGRHAIGDHVVSVFARSIPGLDFDSIDGEPTHIFFMLVSPENQPTLHLRWLAHLAVLLRDEDFRRALLDASSVDEVMAVIEAAEQAHAVAKGVA